MTKTHTIYFELPYIVSYFCISKFMFYASLMYTKRLINYMHKRELFPIILIALKMSIILQISFKF